MITDHGMPTEMWVNEVRAEICECGCETEIHDVDTAGVHCANCGVDCDDISA